MPLKESSSRAVPNATGEAESLVACVLGGSVSLVALPLKSRRSVVRQLLTQFGSDPAAEALVEDLLKGPIPTARPIGRLVASSKKRAILLRAWIGWLRDAAAEYRNDRAEFDLKEVSARGQWIARQFDKMRSVPEELAEDLLDAAADLALLGLESDSPSGPPAEAALAQVIVELEKWVPSLDDKVLQIVATSQRPFRPRAEFLRLLDSRRGEADPLLPRMRVLSLRQDPQFAYHLFHAIPHMLGRSRELARAIRAGCNPQFAAEVIQDLLPSDPERQAAYLEPIMALALEAGELREGLAKVVIDVLATVPAEQGISGVLSATLYSIHASVQSDFDSRLEQARQEHRDAMEEAHGRIRALEEEVKAQRELIESIKKQVREPELQTEHRVRATSLTPVCVIQQEMVLALKDRPDLRLSNMAQTLRGALVRQGVITYCNIGDIVDFDPRLHEYLRSSRARSPRVRIVAPGYQLAHPVLGENEILAPAVVESTDDS